MALAIGAAPATGSRLVGQALAFEGLPGVLDAVEEGVWTERHALAFLGEVDPVGLDPERARVVVLMTLARYAGQSPGALGRMARRVVWQVDRAAAQARRNAASQDRSVRFRADVDGQAVLTARGPAEQIAAIRTRLEADVAGDQHPDDPRTVAQREFDLLVELLTTGSVGDTAVPGAGVQVLVPLSTAAGGDDELAEIPGLGPVLPSVAHDLIRTAASVTPVLVDGSGRVVGVGRTVPGPGRIAPPDAEAIGPEGATPLRRGRLGHGVARRVALQAAAAAAAVSAAPPPSLRYRPDRRLARFVRLRDRTCRFPGCGRRVTDLDHRTPWPLGATDEHNLDALCRHHHRAKHAIFTVTRDDAGTLWWTTRGRSFPNSDP